MEGKQGSEWKEKGKGRQKEKDEGREKGNQVEKWEGWEGNQVSGNFIHPCFFCYDFLRPHTDAFTTAAIDKAVQSVSKDMKECS